MNSIKESTEFSLRERGSKFFGFLFSASSSSQFEQHLLELKNRYPDANHHCCAYRIYDESVQEYNSDDGEPPGTAGLPILNALRSSDLVNIGCVVVRYFGGTKLGKPGLIESYGDTARGCIQKTEIGHIEEFLKINISYHYPEEKEIQRIVRSYQLIEDSSSYQEHIEKMVLCPIDHSTVVLDTLQKLEYKHVTFESFGHTFVMK